MWLTDNLNRAGCGFCCQVFDKRLRGQYVNQRKIYHMLQTRQLGRETVKLAQERRREFY